MAFQKIFLLVIFFALESSCAMPFAEQFNQVGYVEICGEKREAAVFESLYAQFDQFVEFIQKNPVWERKLHSAKERFIRSEDRKIYSTDFFGLYDESKCEGRSQISFYYSIHFHEFLSSRYKEFNQIPEITRFLDTCRIIQKPYGHFFVQAAAELGLMAIFSSQYSEPPLLLKVVKYLPGYTPNKPHYDGSAFTLFLDSTDYASLLLAPYKSSLSAADFSSPQKEYFRWENRCPILLIPGTLLTEFSIYPTPHIVGQSGKTRYSTIAFAMRPNYAPQKIEFTHLPSFKNE